MTRQTKDGRAARYAQLGTGVRNAKTRQFITPEGVDLSLEIAGAGQRLVALIIDLLLMGVILAMGSFAALFLLVDGAARDSGGMLAIIWLLGFFLLRNFWFVLFELGPRAATPGKRIAHIRVVARDGGQLTVAAVVARNLVREIEIFLPIMFMLGSAGDEAASSGANVLGLLWASALSLFLLFNRDRMRLGDLIGGTWVVQARRARMAADLAVAPDGAAANAPVFTPAELSVYGVYELQQLERVIRENHRKTKIAVTDTIRAKIGRTLTEDDDVFLNAYYRQLKDRLERDLLFGKRRANKYVDPT
ncbi:MAG: RDD family protein [Sphingopyxis sp.]